jgi:Peptidase family M28
MRAAALATVLIGLSGVSSAQKVQFNPTNKTELLDRLTEVPQTDLDRAARIKALFAAEGCNGKFLREQPVEGASGPNVICELHGDGEESVVVGAHYDQAATADRPIDNWSAASLLPALYHGLRNRKRHHSFIFVAFADHGADLAGASGFVGHLNPSELEHVVAMVDLDVLGLSPTKVWSSHSSKELVQDLVTMVYALKLPASQIDMERAGATDSDPFARRQIPTITIHSLTEENLAGGTATAFRPNNYYDTYRLLCGYLAYLDTVLKARPHSE